MLTQNKRLGAPKHGRTTRINYEAAALFNNQGQVTIGTLTFPGRPTAIVVSNIGSLSVAPSSNPRPAESRELSKLHDVLIAVQGNFSARDNLSPHTLPVQSGNDLGNKRIKEPQAKSGATPIESTSDRCNGSVIAVALVRSFLTIGVKFKEQTAGDPAVRKSTLKTSSRVEL